MESRKNLDLLERQETFVSGYTRRGHSFPVCPQKAEQCLSKLQREACVAALSLDPRDRSETLKLLPLTPRILCASTSHYPHPTPGSLCHMPLPGSHDPETTSPGEQKAHLRLMQCHAGLCHCRLALHSNYDYCTPPSPWLE